MSSNLFLVIHFKALHFKVLNYRLDYIIIDLRVCQGFKRIFDKSYSYTMVPLSIKNPLNKNESVSITQSSDKLY